MSNPSLLALWPEPAASQLRELVRTHEHSGAYAVFDADNTTYQHDLVGALLPFMENKGLLTRERLHPALQVIPFKDSPDFVETLNSYYGRLGEIDDQVGYPWASQIFSGFTLRELKTELDEMLAQPHPIEAKAWVGGEVVVQRHPVPRFLPGQQALFAALREHGIEVFIVSAAAEELVRMIVSDPRYGYHVKPENVIGVSLALKNRSTHELTTARKLIAAGRYQSEQLLDHELTHSLWAPLPWYEGKYAAIRSHIHAYQRPILVAGDTPQSDGPMFFRGPDTAAGGLRLFMARGQAHLQKMLDLQQHHAMAQQAAKHPVTADHNWVVVQVEALGVLI
jgi:phosphoserine phosphatase